MDRMASRQWGVYDRRVQVKRALRQCAPETSWSCDLWHLPYLGAERQKGAYSTELNCKSFFFFLEKESFYFNVRRYDTAVCKTNQRNEILTMRACVHVFAREPRCVRVCVCVCVCVCACGLEKKCVHAAEDAGSAEEKNQSEGSKE